MTFSKLFSRPILFSFCLLGITISLIGCENPDDNKVLAAQQCFNKLNDSATSPQIDACLAKISGIDSENAYTIRCSAEFLRGGLTTAKMITAFDGYKKVAKAQQEAFLVDQLSLTPNDTAADAAYNDCAKTGIPGLNYIATLARLGTKIKYLGSGGSGAGGIQAQITTCATTPGTCDDAAIGEMVSNMSDLYCKGDAVKQQICIDIASAKAASGSDTAAIAIALYNQIGY